VQEISSLAYQFLGSQERPSFCEVINTLQRTGDADLRF